MFGQSWFVQDSRPRPHIGAQQPKLVNSGYRDGADSEISNKFEIYDVTVQEASKSTSVQYIWNI